MHYFHIKEHRDFVFSYDEEARAAYIRVRVGRVHKTFEHAPNVFVDVNAQGNLIGIEVLNPKQISINIVSQIAREYKIPGLKNINLRAIPNLFAAA